MFVQKLEGRRLENLTAKFIQQFRAGPKFE